MSTKKVGGWLRQNLLKNFRVKPKEGIIQTVHRYRQLDESDGAYALTHLTLIYFFETRACYRRTAVCQELLQPEVLYFINSHILQENLSAYQLL